MTENELSATLKRERWTLQISYMAGGKRAYAAKQRQDGKLATRYIGTENSIQEMDERDVLAKLSRLARSKQ